VRDTISIDHFGSKLSQQSGNSTFAARDIARQSDDVPCGHHASE
jgi:hypothetical protein